MLQKYLTNLESERANEIEHEAFCTRELASNNRTKKQKTAKVESLTAARRGRWCNPGCFFGGVCPLPRSDSQI